MQGNVKYQKQDIQYLNDTGMISVSYEIEIASNINANYYVDILANRLGIKYEDLFSIIAFETGGSFDPKIVNKESGAMGLIQFTNSTAQSLVDPSGRKFSSVLELINTYPTVKAQLAIPSRTNVHGGPVYQYLIRNYPYSSTKELYLTVFYPSAIGWKDHVYLPGHVRKANPGLNKVSDYENAVHDKIKLNPHRIDCD
jgi:hypothetical protein